MCKGFKCLDVGEGRVYIYRDVVFMRMSIPLLNFILIMLMHVLDLKFSSFYLPCSILVLGMTILLIHLIMIPTH